MRLAPDSHRPGRSLLMMILVAILGTLLPVSIALAQSAPSPADIRQMLDAKNFAGAEKALQALPDSDATLPLRAELYRRTDRLDEARLLYKRIVAANPSNVDAQFWVATIDRWRDRNNDALTGYGKVLALSNCHHDALTGRARVEMALQNFAAAEADLRTTLTCDPGDVEATELLSEMLERRGDRAAAEAVLQQSFKGADLESHLGDLEMVKKNANAARAHYRAALKARPDDPVVLNKLAAAERTLGNNGAALEYYEKSAAITRDGGDLYWIGVVAMRLGRLDRAEAAFDELLKRKPGDVGALIGKARVRRSQGRPAEALEYVDEVLLHNARNGEALVLRGALKETLGRKAEARNDYFAALGHDSGDYDARLLFDRVGPPNYFTIGGRSNRSRVIEGLEDVGVLVDGIPIRPARIEYLTDSIDLETGIELGNRTTLGAVVSRGREAVRNIDSRGMIYDFDVLTAQAGLDQRLSDHWRFSWRVGGTRYEPTSTAAIETSNRFRGNAELGYSRGGTDLVFGYTRRPLIQRGFAADTQFRIFDEDRFTLAWGRSLARGVSFRFFSGASSFGSGNNDSPVNGGVLVSWDHGDENAWFVRAGHDPFPARFLGPGQTLEFIDFDGITLGGRKYFGAGFRFRGDVTFGRYGETPRDMTVGGIRIEGPKDNNSGRNGSAELAWSPKAFRPFSIGGAFDYAHFNFRTSPYNTRNFNDRSAFLDLTDQTNMRTHYAFRAGHHWVSDERAAKVYDGNEYRGLFEVRLGKFPQPRGSYWLGFEGQYLENDLDEEGYKVRAYLTVPF